MQQRPADTRERTWQHLGLSGNRDEAAEPRKTFGVCRTTTRCPFRPEDDGHDQRKICIIKGVSKMFNRVELVMSKHNEKVRIIIRYLDLRETIDRMEQQGYAFVKYNVLNY